MNDLWRGLVVAGVSAVCSLLSWLISTKLRVEGPVGGVAIVMAGGTGAGITAGIFLGDTTFDSVFYATILIVGYGAYSAWLLSRKTKSV